MEDDRGKFIVVVAGYADRMQEWLSVNEGLSSRFTHTIHLDDYNSDELFELFCLYAKKEKLHLSGGAEIEARTLLHYIWENRGTDFANGRTVRKIYDAVVRKKNSRIIKLSEEERTKEVLTTITEEDFNFKE